MLFTSSTFRRGGAENNNNSSILNNLEYRRKSLLVRRHTCSVLDPSKISNNAAILAPLGSQFARVHLLDASTNLLNNKSLTSTPRSSLCIPLFSSSLISSNFRSSSTTLLRRSITLRRRSHPKFNNNIIIGVAQNLANTSLMPALLNTPTTPSSVAASPPSAPPPPLPQIINNKNNNSKGQQPPSAIYEIPPISSSSIPSSLYPQIPQEQKQEPSAPKFDPWDAPNFSQTSTFASKNNNQLPPEISTDRKAPSLDDDFDDDWSDEDEEVAYASSKEQQIIVVEDAKNVSSKKSEKQTEVEEEEQIFNKEKTVLVEQHSLLTTSSDTSKTNTTGKQEFTSASHSINDTAISSKMVARSRSTGPDTCSMTKQQITTGGTTRIKNLNRFTNFVKTGMEGYILSTAKFNSAPVEQPQIILDARIGGVDGVKWNSLPTHYTCMVTKPKKETKLKGLKSFIAYSLTCSATGIQVSRRYKQFDWLHLQLSNKYLIIPIPPLPEKQVSGRWEEDLIEHRRSILQLWVNKICRHPVLSQSEVWRHFMNCTDEAKWKKGKRIAEKDEYVGGNFFSSIIAPDVVLDVANVGTTVERFARLSRSLDESCRKIYDQVVETQKRMAGPYKANWQKMAAAFDSLGQSLDIENRQTNNSVQNAIKTSAHVLHKIGEQHEEHGRKDLEQLLDFLFVAKGTSSAISDVVNIHKSAFAKIRENERYQNEGKISAEDAENIRQKVDACSYAMLAEINHQQSERDLDFSTMFGSFFSQQAAFYHNIGNQLTHLATLFKPAK